MILDVEPEEDEEEEEEEEDDEENETGEERMRHAGERRNHSRMPSDLSMIEGSAELLYGLIHQRFICSRAGIQQMSEKYELSHFGVCPRTYCNLARTLPVGLSDIPGEDTVKLFCPSCLDVYVPPNSRFQTVDGAFFGRTFGALFLLTFPEYDLTKNGVEALTTVSSLYAGQSGGSPTVNGIYARNIAPGLGHGKIFEPKIYGFRVSERARSGPRMQWLRSKPDDIADLDETRKHNEMEQQRGGADSDGDVHDSDHDVSNGHVAADGGRGTGATGGRRPPTGGSATQQLATNADGSTGRPSDAQLRQHQNGSPMTVDANGVESEL